MDLHCPYCQHTMNVKGVRAGTFAPKCPNCHEKFGLTIPEGEGAVPRVKALTKPTALPAAGPAGVTAPPTAQSAAVTTPPRPVATAGVTVPPAVTTPPSTAVAATVAPAPRTVLPQSNSAGGGAALAGLSGSASGTSRGEDRAAEAAPPRPSRPAMPSGDDGDVPTSLGGYQILRKLGQGGMGAVYLARQVSLDRPVAVKVLAPGLAQDAGFVARFTREAYAAAQLSHHNVVQVYDIGEERGRHFYSMEFVEGSTLAGVVARDGKLDPEAAVGYVLQAARGLKYAHDHGLIHRDVKPDNLMLSDQGIVKVADLGLVKKYGVADVAGGSKLDRAQSADVTGFAMSMGTPAYMAPEQARDAAHVDHRADIYSLGCTLYDLLTGRPPFAGKTAMEVITKHASEPITPPDVLAKRVPKELSALLMKMVAKRPEDRYATTGECIAAMEGFLGTGSAGPFTPTEAHASALESAAKQFNDAPLAITRRYAVPAFFGLCALLAVAAVLLGSTLQSRVTWAAAYLGVAVATTVSYVVITGITRRNVVFVKLRQFAFGARVVDWLKVLLVLAVAGLLLVVLDLVWVGVGVLIVGVGLAAAFHFGLEWPRDRQRKTPVEQTETMLRTIRLRGLDEDTLRQFVCRYAGRHWEEFYEALFGYAAKVDARRRWSLGLRGQSRPKFARWRDAVVAWADGRIAARKDARERRLLARTEEAKLKAEGVDLLAARKKAQKDADAMARRAAAFKSAETDRPDARSLATAAPTPAEATAPPMTALPRAAVTVVPSPLFAASFVEESAVEREHESGFARRHGGLLGFLFGPTFRFPAALLLLAVFGLWFHQANPQFPQNFGTTFHDTVESGYAELRPAARPGAPAAVARAPVKSSSTDLRLPLVPQNVLHRASGYGVGLAGLLLLASCLFGGWKLGLLTWLGAAVVIAGDSVVPGFGGRSAAVVAGLAGTGLFVLGVLFGRER